MRPRPIIIRVAKSGHITQFGAVSNDWRIFVDGKQVESGHPSMSAAFEAADEIAREYSEVYGSLTPVVVKDGRY